MSFVQFIDPRRVLSNVVSRACQLDRDADLALSWGRVTQAAGGDRWPLAGLRELGQ